MLEADIKLVLFQISQKKYFIKLKPVNPATINRGWYNQKTLGQNLQWRATHSSHWNAPVLLGYFTGRWRWREQGFYSRSERHNSSSYLVLSCYPGLLCIISVAKICWFQKGQIQHSKGKEFFNWILCKFPLKRYYILKPYHQTDYLANLCGISSLITERKMNTKGLSKPCENKIDKGFGQMLVHLPELWLRQSSGRSICSVTTEEFYVLPHSKCLAGWWDWR